MTNSFQAKLVFPEVDKKISISRKIVTFISRLIFRFKEKQSEHQLRRTAIHEAGHAIVALMTEHEVFGISIIPNKSSWGRTWFNDLKRMEWFSTPILQMVLSYGGHVAEELFFGESQFFGTDKKFVDEIAFNMVTKWGMSPNLKFKYLNFKTASEEDKKLVNNEIKSIKEKAKTFAMEIINEHRNEVIKEF